MNWGKTCRNEEKDMKYTKLGNSDLNVSRICMGCMGFGNAATGQHSWTLDEEHSREIIRRVEETAQKRGVSMTEVALAWLLGKVTAPVVGATKVSHIETTAKAVDLQLTPQENAYLEEPYRPHPLAGVMAQNKPSNAKEKHVWSVGSQKI